MALEIFVVALLLSFIIKLRFPTNVSRNYIILAARVITENISCLKFLRDSVEEHIQHQYSREITKPIDNISVHTICSMQKKY